MTCLCGRWRSCRPYNLPVTSIAIMNLACFPAFQLKASLDIFAPDSSSHDGLFRCISHTSAPAHVGLSYGEAHQTASSARQRCCSLPSVSSQTHHHTGQGAGRRRVRCRCSLLGGRADVGLCTSALEELWGQPFRRMRVKSLEICHVFSISSKVCLLLALT